MEFIVIFQSDRHLVGRNFGKFTKRHNATYVARGVYMVLISGKSAEDIRNEIMAEDDLEDGDFIGVFPVTTPWSVFGSSQRGSAQTVWPLGEPSSGEPPR